MIQMISLDNLRHEDEQVLSRILSNDKTSSNTAVQNALNMYHSAKSLHPDEYISLAQYLSMALILVCNNDNEWSESSNNESNY